jgi:hypothetical protein
MRPFVNNIYKAQNLGKCIYLLVFIIGFSSCFHRQCPIKGCQVRHEHSHGGQIVRGRGTFPRIHFFGIERTTAAKKEAANNRRRKQKK